MMWLSSMMTELDIIYAEMYPELDPDLRSILAELYKPWELEAHYLMFVKDCLIPGLPITVQNALNKYKP